MKLFNQAYVGSFRGRFMIALALICMMLVMRYSGIGSYINFNFIRQHQEALQAYIQDHYLVSVVTFLAIYILVVACAIPISIILNVAAGYFFGVIQAIIYSNIGSTGGALLSFLTFRYLLREGLMERYGTALARFNKQFKKQGAYYLLFLQLLPITPFGVITILAGLSTISLWTFYWTTAVGILPGSAIYAYTGSKLADIASARDILSWPVIIALSLLALLALIPVIIQRLRVSSDEV